MRIVHFLSVLAVSYAGRKPDALNKVQSTSCKLSPDLGFGSGDNQTTPYTDLETISQPDVGFLEPDAHDTQPGPNPILSIQPNLVLFESDEGAEEDSTALNEFGADQTTSQSDLRTISRPDVGVESDANGIALQPDLVSRSDTSKRKINNTSKPDAILFESGKGTGHDTTALNDFERNTRVVEKEKFLSPDTGSGADLTTSQSDLETSSRPHLGFLESDENKTIQPDLVPKCEKQETTSQLDPVLFESGKGTGQDTTALTEFEQNASVAEKEKPNSNGNSSFTQDNQSLLSNRSLLSIRMSSTINSRPDKPDPPQKPGMFNADSECKMGCENAGFGRCECDNCRIQSRCEAKGCKWVVNPNAKTGNGGDCEGAHGLGVLVPLVLILARLAF